ncbi:hypothetical protein CROQUDRAFT_73989 [Cronartium quercuum f. sp. fusiforme G11]|uniref:chitin deacetylase n=1 Tax=Cronartium quercuum f. sp. fusiforme G11 TaxID=708437 RepID=A0A9P6NU48_9BASI|nr:hypothetical protein CROQUDRAFT_73989 [Cronartium quercuum f. sp. fusiforme G11]
MAFCFSLILLASFLVYIYQHCQASKQHLFERQTINYPPLDVNGPTPKPEWVTAYDQETKAGRIPQFEPSVKLSSGDIQYDSSLNPTSPKICSWTKGCISPTDINNAPDGMMGVSFDDGPQLATPTLLSFLRTVNQTVTHFMIGSRILENTQGLLTALQQGDHIAVHTWSHPMMSTQSDHAVLGELGWTLQIIYDKTGRLPAYWRPPYGDVDNRVRAIAKNVFGLQTVIWNHDTNDWCLTPQGTSTCGSDGPANEAAVTAEMKGFVKSSKSPGLIILEHELTTHSIAGFINSWSSIKAFGWDTRPIASLFEQPWYQNANGAFDTPITLTSLINASSAVTESKATILPSSQITQNTTQPTTTFKFPEQEQSGSSFSQYAQIPGLVMKTFIIFLSLFLYL